MTSPLLALFIRSLREDSRLKFTYLSRTGLVLVILLFLYSTQATMGWMNAPGLRFFGTIVAVDLCFVILAGVSYFSSAISEEKEEMTLGLLRMTNLNPLSILLGKSTSRLCTALLLFVAQIPFTMLAITLGGISLRQIGAAFLVIGAFLVFVSNLALFYSVICRRTSGAAILTGLSLLLFFIFHPLAIWFGQLPIRMEWLDPANGFTQILNRAGRYVEAASPFGRIGKILTTGFAGRVVTPQVLSNLGVGLLFFLLAWLAFEKFCGEQKESAPGPAGIGPRTRTPAPVQPRPHLEPRPRVEGFLFHHRRQVLDPHQAPPLRHAPGRGVVLAAIARRAAGVGTFWHLHLLVHGRRDRCGTGLHRRHSLSQ